MAPQDLGILLLQATLAPIGSNQAKNKTARALHE